MNTLGYLAPPKTDNDDDDMKQDEEQGFSVVLVLFALGFMYSVHNLIAPNMTAIARVFHFNAYERDAYIGGELTLFFYFPGVFGALIAGVLSGVLERRLLLALLCLITAITCFITARVSSFGELAWARATTGFAIGGSLPVVYSLIGDWFPASRRATATAFVTAASGAGVFVGQCVATLMGAVDWRLPFLAVAIPTAISGVCIWRYSEEPQRGGKEDGVETLVSYQRKGYTYMPVFTSRHMRTLVQNKTNLLVTIQAFPGNIPWGVIIVYIHDFLVQDLGMSMHRALGAITTLAGSAFAGVICGGFIGEHLYKMSVKHAIVFGGVCNTARALPFLVIFGWKEMFGPLEKTSETAFFATLMIGGFMSSMASPCTGAMLLNVNLPETRGTVMAMYSVLDDLSKGFGTLFVSLIVRLVGGRAMAYQLSLFLWVFTGMALLYTVFTYDEDEQQMRRNLDEAAMESMVLLSKQRAQNAIRERAKAAGEAHRERSTMYAATVVPRQSAPVALSFAKWPSLPGLLAGATGNTVDYSPVVSSEQPDILDRPYPHDSFSQQVHLDGQPGRSVPCNNRVASGVGRSSAERERLHKAAKAAADAVALGRNRGP